MKVTATALVSLMTLSTGLASVIQAPLYTRELPDSQSLLQRRSPLDDMDPLDALRLVLLRRAVAPPAPAGGKGASGGGDKGGKAGATGGDKAGDKGAKQPKQQEAPWVPPSVRGQNIDKNTLKCNSKTHSCSGDITVG